MQNVFCKLLLLTLLSFIFSCHITNVGDLYPDLLVIEYQKQPLAFQEERPRFSWQCKPIRENHSLRNLRQSAFHIIAATSPELLAKSTGDLWDSGKIASDSSILISYKGKPFASRQQVFWQVRIWDQNNKPSAWSQPARFRMGLLSANDWTAKWIKSRDLPAPDLRRSKWIWFNLPDKAGHYPPGAGYFFHPLLIPANTTIESAHVCMTCDDQFELFVNGFSVLRGADSGAALQTDIKDYLKSGKNELQVRAVNKGSKPSSAGLLGSLQVLFANGTQTSLLTDGSWLCSVDSSTHPHLNPVTVLGPYGMPPWQQVQQLAEALPIFRRDFKIDAKIRQARAYICGLGQYEMYMNGQRIGQHVMTPVWSQYAKTCYYDCYDVTPVLKSGGNAVAVMLGNGMYHVPGGRYIKFRGSLGLPKLIVQIEIDYENGRQATVISDENWRTIPGPITFSCIFGGEDFNGRRWPKGWDRFGFNDDHWQYAEITSGPGGVLRATPMPGITVQKTLPTIRIMQPRAGVYVYDLGQNFSGWPRITVRGNSGRTIRLIPGELLDHNGLVTQRHSGEPMWFSYTLRGSETEIWRPRFSYYGFRYVQVEGAIPQSLARNDQTQPVLIDMQGEFFYNSSAVSGSFSCSDTLINDIHNLILNAIRSNFQSVLTDCPHREKLGWLEVSHLLSRGIMYNFHVPPFYAKISQDMSESQLSNGLVPDIAPEFTVFSQGFRDSPEWGSAVVFNPAHVLQMYGDDRLLSRHYPVMSRYVDYLTATAHDHIISHGLGDWYDIGPAGPGFSQLTSTGLTATAIYYGDLQIVAETAYRLGKQQEAVYYTDLATQVQKSFTNRFFHADSLYYDRAGQTAQAMPLVLGLVEPDKRSYVLQGLVDVVRKNQNRVTAGDVGFRYLIKSLSDAGRDDVIYDLVTQKEGPGYADQLRKGATSLTEAWDANPFSSQNHCMLGHVEEWFYAGLAGIQPDSAKPGFKNCIIRPAFLRSVQWVKSAYETPYGVLSIHWKRAHGRILMELTIPVNSNATLYLPAQSLTDILESDKPIAHMEGILDSQIQSDKAVLNLASGRYFFSIAE